MNQPIDQKRAAFVAALRAGAEAEARAVVARAGLESHLTSPGWGRVRMTFDQPIQLPQP